MNPSTSKLFPVSLWPEVAARAVPPPPESRMCSKISFRDPTERTHPGAFDPACSLFGDSAAGAQLSYWTTYDLHIHFVVLFLAFLATSKEVKSCQFNYLVAQHFGHSAASSGFLRAPWHLEMSMLRCKGRLDASMQACHTRDRPIKNAPKVSRIFGCRESLWETLKHVELTFGSRAPCH